MKKPLVFITNIKSSHNFLHFRKDLRSINSWQWNDGPLKKNWRNRFLAADFETCKKEKILNSPNLSNMARGTLILKDCDITSYPCSNYGPSNLLFRFNNSCKVLDLKSLWKSEIMRTFDIHYENGWFLHRSLVKEVRNR